MRATRYKSETFVEFNVLEIIVEFMIEKLRKKKKEKRNKEEICTKKRKERRRKKR